MKRKEIIIKAFFLNQAAGFIIIFPPEYMLRQIVSFCIEESNSFMYKAHQRN